ncbi:MAG: hypothetical protein ACRDP1_02390 [Nocardioidaceae bacterium]
MHTTTPPAAGHDNDRPPDTMPDLTGYIEHFRARVAQDALNQATSRYWHLRAQTFDDARPQPGDYTGNATPTQIAAQDARLTETAQACRNRATICLLQTIEPGTVTAVREAAPWT